MPFRWPTADHRPRTGPYRRDRVFRRSAVGGRPSCSPGCPAALLIGLLLLLAGCHALQIEQTSTRASGWLTEGNSPERRSAVEAALAPPLREVWSYNAGAGFGPGSPLVLGEVVFAATRKGEVHAIDLASGRRLGINRFGEAVEGTPLIRDGVLYVPVAWGRRALYAYDLRRGTTLWSARHAPIEAGLLHLGTLLFGVDVEGHARAYDLQNGTVRWEQALGERTMVRAAPALAGNLVVVADDRGHVTALQAADGSRLWTQDLRTPVHATPAALEGTLFVPTTRGRFFALDRDDGTVRWRFEVPDTTVYLTSPAVGTKEVVFGGSDGIVRALDPATGTVRWTFEAGEVFGAVPLITQNVVYIGGMDQQLYALDRQTGALRWKEKLKGRLKSAMAARDGFLVVLSEARTVHLFESSDAGYAANE